MGGEIFFQRGVVLSPALRAANGVDVQLHAGDAQGFQNGGGQRDDLRIRLGGGSAEAFHPKLVEFPQAARLGLLVPVAGGDVGGLHRQGAGQQAVLQRCPGRARRPLGTQGNGALPLIQKGIHLLLHHVVVSPTDRWNSAVCSKTGVRISR